MYAGKILRLRLNSVNHSGPFFYASASLERSGVGLDVFCQP